MIKSLSINNIAVISSAVIDFDSGLNILTGETGAGKSIIIDSINLILGNRASKEIIRNGEQTAKVEALFDIDTKISKHLEEFGIECEDELLISREINTEGRNTIRINGALSTVSILKSIGPYLINIHGQNDNQDLLNSDKHINLLDNYANNLNLLSEYKKVFKEAQQINSEINKINIDNDEKERKISLLTYEIEIIDNAALKKGEYEELIEKRKLISNSQKIIDSANEAYSKLSDSYNGLSANELVSSAMKKLNDVSSYDNELAEISDKLSDVYYNLEDVIGSISSYISSFSFNEEEIDEIERRIDELNSIRRRFGADYDEIMEYYTKISAELKDINMMDENIDKLKISLNEKKKILKDLSEKLSESRRKAAQELDEEVVNHLSELNMPNTVFKTDIKNEEKFSKDGVDKVEFLICANAGLELGKLSKIASGGELSRVMLAINCALLDTNEVSTMIYDEIDTGVSGRAAQKIAEKLYYVSTDRQVLCVTHLAQIASMADTHLLIEKNVSDNVTNTTVTKLANDERINELARIIGGAQITNNTLLSAQDMLLQSQTYKTK